METTAPSRPPRWLIILEGIFAIIIGISLLVQPGRTFYYMVQVLGLYWFVGGWLALSGQGLDALLPLLTSG